MLFGLRGTDIMSDELTQRLIEFGQACVTCTTRRPQWLPAQQRYTLWACSMDCVRNFNGDPALIGRKVVVGYCGC